MNIATRMMLAAGLAACVGCDQPSPAPQRGPQRATAPTADATPPKTVREKAAVGMGDKGRGYDDGPIATPIKALWSAKEQIALIQIQDAMQIYKVMDPNNRGPKSHDEFMEQIIKANHINLPALPEGHRYVYDPAKEELLVERPR